ncbi:hypothetical protein AAG906_014496 [Vitis piasezkii]|uniref:RRM domain-containing protein n=2 Tax=Vitis vinifera TaxID=29760 RepID=A0ABY9CFM1_VITVI|nr:uncharacterized protein LOC100241364 [Vitis vinifera]WJZ93236.1 hypothetical protein VitviT2T_012192 [Vitis vinifera]|eukprot:XP_002274013.2 PREDICTED: uncharacterized protein LOC100241364 [Vitis vinifera]
MWKMNPVANANRWNRLLQTAKPSQGLPLLIRSFSTEAEAPQVSSSDPFLQPPSTGLVYGRLSGITKHTLRTDILNLLEGCNLTLQDVKVDYNRSYFPVGMMVQFPSRYAFDHAIKVINKKGRLYKLDRADRSQWDPLRTYDGKTVLLQGLPRNALPEDVERFLAGCEFNSSNIQLTTRQAFPDPIRMALVHFPSQSQAMNAFITKNRGFCLNNQILVRVLH